MTRQSSSGLAGKVVIVTGAGQGIGEAVAGLFAAEGALVVVNARTEGNVQRVAGEIASAGGTALGVVADIGSPEGVQALVRTAVERFGAIDVLVHNAGIYPLQPVEKMEDRDWNQVLEVNLTSAFRLTKACLPHLKERKNGRLLFTSSVTGNRTGVGGLAHYGASKAGLNGFIRAVAIEVAPYGITVNGVEPGLVLTPGAAAATTPEEREAMARFVPLKRWGTPMDIAHAMLYLASEAASYVTGQTIIVDGGALLPENGALMM
jgi:3-oxoacyl-[acyl-carrier protein] reductase